VIRKHEICHDKHGARGAATGLTSYIPGTPEFPRLELHLLYISLAGEVLAGNRAAWVQLCQQLRLGQGGLG
jgi:hypothetical protein